MNRLVAAALFLALGVACAEDGAPAEVPAAVVTDGGSRLIGMLASDKPLVLDSGDRQPISKQPEIGVSPRYQKLDLAKVRSILFGERFDPNLENEAQLAVGDLQSDQFATREKALARLRSLGRTAFQALKAASASTDPEVASRARLLLGEMGLLGATAAPGDTVVLEDGRTVQGVVLPAELALRSRWGRLKFPLSRLASLERLVPEEVNAEKLAPAVRAAITIKAKAIEADAGRLERMSFPIESIQGEARTERSDAGLFMLTMDRLPNQDRAWPPDKRTTAAKAGDRLEDAYAAWGILLRPVDPKAEAKAVEDPDKAPRPKLVAQVEKSDCDVQFVLPGSHNRKTGAFRPGGVAAIGAIVVGEQDVGMTAFDKSGRQVGEVYSLRDPAWAMQHRRFVGLRSTLPIARVRLFRTGAGKGGDLLIDELMFDRIVPVERPPGTACVWFSTGERLIGQLSGASLADGLSLRPEFLDEGAAPVQTPLDEAERFEPPYASAPTEPGKAAAPEAKALRVLAGTPHGVLLQGGECFRARLLKLDASTALFMLAGGAELKLPRAVLRKLDLEPAAAAPGEQSAPVVVLEDEKPGVSFRRKEGAKSEIPKKAEGPAEKAKAEPEEKLEHSPKKKKKDVLQTIQELEPMPNVEIIEVDMLTSELTIKDANGEMTIGMAPVKSLVFSKDPHAQPAGPRSREWVLALREGSRFQVALTALSVEALTVEMTGAQVILPWGTIESIERARKR